MHIASTDRRRLWATMALDWAKNALHAAEQNANSDEIITLCEEVIKGRLRVLQCDIDAGWEPPADVRLQIARDKELLRQANEKNGVYYA